MLITREMEKDLSWLLGRDVYFIEIDYDSSLQMRKGRVVKINCFIYTATHTNFSLDVDMNVEGALYKPALVRQNLSTKRVELTEKDCLNQFEQHLWHLKSYFIL